MFLAFTTCPPYYASRAFVMGQVRLLRPGVRSWGFGVGVSGAGVRASCVGRGGQGSAFREISGLAVRASGSGVRARI